MRPYCASRNTMGTPRLAANQLSTRCDCAVTSGPMPSPPTTATLIMLERLFMRDCLPFFLRSGSRAALPGRPPERRGFRRRAAMSARPRRDLPAARRAGADRSQNRAAAPKATVIVCCSRSMLMRPAPWVCCTSAARPSTISLSTTTGRMPFWKQLAKKMSPKLEPMTARMPISCSDQTAPSREEPQPKFGPVIRISACR